MHGFIKISKLYMSFSGLTDQNMNAQEAKICIFCKDFWFVKKSYFGGHLGCHI